MIQFHGEGGNKTKRIVAIVIIIIVAVMLATTIWGAFSVL